MMDRSRFLGDRQFIAHRQTLRRNLPLHRSPLFSKQTSGFFPRRLRFSYYVSGSSGRVNARGVVMLSTAQTQAIVQGANGHFFSYAVMQIKNPDFFTPMYNFIITKR